MDEFAIDRRAQHLHAELFELRRAVAEGNDLRRADEGEIERIEEQQNVLLPLVIAKADLVERAIGQHGVGLEFGSRLLHENAHEKPLENSVSKRHLRIRAGPGASETRQ